MADQPKTPKGWSTKPWSSVSESDYKTPEEFCSACLIDLNTGEKVKDLCYLPVKMPRAQGGAVNERAVLAAAGGRGITRVKKPSGVSSEKFASAKRAAANKIIRLYGQMGRTAPDSIYQIAGKSAPKKGD